MKTKTLSFFTLLSLFALPFLWLLSNRATILLWFCQWSPRLAERRGHSAGTKESVSLHLGLVAGPPPAARMIAPPDGQLAEMPRVTPACGQSTLPFSCSQSGASLKHKAEPTSSPGDTILCVLCVFALQKPAHFNKSPENPFSRGSDGRWWASLRKSSACSWKPPLKWIPSLFYYVFVWLTRCNLANKHLVHLSPSHCIGVTIGRLGRCVFAGLLFSVCTGISGGPGANPTSHLSSSSSLLQSSPDVGYQAGSDPSTVLWWFHIFSNSWLAGHYLKGLDTTVRCCHIVHTKATPGASFGRWKPKGVGNSAVKIVVQQEEQVWVLKYRSIQIQMRTIR